MKSLLFVLLCFASASASVFADTEGEIAQSVFKFQSKMAESGNVEAQFKIAEMYEEGRGVEQSYDNAIKWYNRAAGSGHPQANDRISAINQKRSLEAQAAIEAKRRAADEEARARREAIDKKRAEEQRQRAEEERRRQADIAKRKAEVEKARMEAEARRIEMERRQQLEMDQRKAELEKARQQDEARRKAEEQRRQEEMAKREAELAKAREEAEAEQQENSGYQTNPCKGATARFMSICK